MYKLIRSLLFRLPAELSHDIALQAMNLGERVGLLAILAAKTKKYAVPKTVMGIDFPHVVGLAAGLDKNADYADALQALGFGWLELVFSMFRKWYHTKMLMFTHVGCNVAMPSSRDVQVTSSKRALLTR